MTASKSLGEAVRGDRVSYWVASAPTQERRAAEPPPTADVIVVGAGIVGLTCAFVLAEAGRDVTVLEAQTLATGVSGYTTAKLTAGHGLAYSRLESSFGEEAAAQYAQAQLDGLDYVRVLVAERSIECDLETVSNYVFAESEEERESLVEEAAAASRAGLAAEVVDDLDVPFPAAAAVCLPDQAQFHPRRYLLALAELVEAAGGRIVERARVTEITGTGPLVVHNGDRTLQAQDVVVATHYPIVEQGFFITRLHPRRSYVVAAPLEGPLLEGMYINVGSPTRSVRTTPLGDGRRLLMVGGEGHRVGQETDTPARYATLERHLREHFAAGEIAYRWSTQDTFTVDGMPYVGQAGDTEGLYVATGFAGWGMTNGTAAALALAGAVQGTSQPWSSLFALDRASIRASAKRFLTENTNLAVQQAAGAKTDGARSPQALEPGAGAVLTIDGNEVAVSRDSSGALHAVQSACTHMGCTVAWNGAESTWDCPRHGSRFAPDGRVVHGPALEPLETVELDSLREEVGA